MKKNLILIFIFSLIVLDYLLAQTEKRIRRDDLRVSVGCIVGKLSEGYLRFSYVFENSSLSNQSMHRAIVELNDEWLENSGSIRNSVPPSEKDWGGFPSVGEKMWWIAEYDTTGLDILERAPRSAILPGESLSFSFEATGLPGIGQYWAAGWAPWFFSEEERDSLLQAGYSESELHATDDKFLRGYTLVRRTPPDPFDPIVFLDTLISYKHQAFALGWIKEEGIVTSLDSKLEAARPQIINDRPSAKQILQSFINELDALITQSDQITSKAHALLKFNAEFLISKL